MRKMNVLLSTVAALALVGVMSYSAPARADGLPAVTQATAKAEVFDAGKPVAVLFVGKDCKDCAAAEALLASKAAAHPGDKFVKLVQDGVTEPGLLVFAPGIQQPVYEADGFHPTASDIDAVLADIDSLTGAYAQKAQIDKPFDDQRAAVKADFTTFVKPWVDQINALKQKLEADPKIVAAKADAEAQKGKMEADPAYKAAQAQIDALYAKAGVTDLAAQAKKAAAAGDIMGYIQAQGAMQQKLDALSDADKASLQKANDALDAATKPYADAVKADEQKMQAAAAPYIQQAQDIQKAAREAIEKHEGPDANGKPLPTSFQARMDKIAQDETAAEAGVSSKINTAQSDLDKLIQAEQPAAPAQK